MATTTKEQRPTPQTPANNKPAPSANGTAKPQEPPKQQEPTRSVNPYLDKIIEYKPFGGESPIKLCARLVLEFLCKPTKSGAKCTVEQAVQFVMLCQARALNPWEGDAFIVGYDSKDGPTFSLITAHNAFLKRAEAHPQFDGMDSGVIVNRSGVLVDLDGDFYIGEDILVGAWAKVHRKDRNRPTIRRVKLATFNSGYSQWAKNPGGMIVKCCEADALRSTFPNTLAGMYLRDEMEAANAATVSNGTSAPKTAQERVAGIKGAAPQPPSAEKQVVIPAVVIRAEQPETVEEEPRSDKSEAFDDLPPEEPAKSSKDSDPENPFTNGEIPAGEMFPQETGSVDNMR